MLGIKTKKEREWVPKEREEWEDKGTLMGFALVQSQPSNGIGLEINCQDEPIM